MKHIPYTTQRIGVYKHNYRPDDRIDLFLTYYDTPAGGLAKQYRAEINWVEYPEGSMVDPFTQIDPTQSQTLMDSLWECGVRPSQGSGSAGSLAATERHLADMQKLVFKGK